MRQRSIFLVSLIAIIVEFDVRRMNPHEIVELERGSPKINVC